MLLRTFRVGVAALLLVAFALAQLPDRIAPAAWLQVAEGAVSAHGPAYSARFDEQGVEFTPALGVAADRPCPLRFTLTSVRRGATDQFVPVAPVPPAVAGNRVRYAHPGGPVEIYDVGDDGIEQSFVFADRPEGSGDLVVRGRITTELPLASVTDEGVRYERAGVGGVAFGAVTGIDANGASARGSIRVEGEYVEWRLPAGFVDQAAYPLVLDPLIGAAFAIGNAPGGDDEKPSVAYDMATNRYLVVWNVVLSATVAEVRGQIVSGSGALVLTSFVIDTNCDVSVRPDVASVRAAGRWLVVWKRFDPLASGPNAGAWVRAVAPATGAMSAPVLVELPTATNSAPTEVAVGGDHRSAFLGANLHALVVLRKDSGLFAGSNRVRSFLVQVPSAGDPVVGVAQDLSVTSNLLGDIAVTANAGAAGRWLVAYCEAVGASAPFVSVKGHVVFQDGLPCGSPIPLVSGSTGVQNPTVATSTGTHFAVAWQDDATVGILARTLTWSGSCGTGAASLGVTIDPTSAGLDSEPALEFAGDKYVLAWRRTFLFGSVPRVFVRGLDPDGCVACGAELSVDNTLLGLDTPALASRWSGGDTTSDEGLVVWSNTAIRGRRFEATGAGTVTSMGGSCGITGLDNFATYDGSPVLGNLDFELVLANPTLPVLALVIGLSNQSIPCGPCTLVPSLDILSPGATSIVVPLPCDLSYLGLEFYAQWLLFAPGGCPVFPDFALSNALKFTVAE